MPYITRERREQLEAGFEPLPMFALTPGDLNFLITRLVYEYWRTHGKGYTAQAEINGVLSDVKQEIYRRVFANFEDKKCQQNGDVYAQEDLSS